MHIQIRTSLKVAAFADGDPVEGSAGYPPGTLAEVLAVLAENRGSTDPGFSLAAASGKDIELGGEFSFWVHPRGDIDNDDHEVATEKALARIRAAGYDAHRYDVRHRYLTDAVGELKAFVDEVSGDGLHIAEISIGAPEPDGIPVQIFTVQTR